MRRKSWISLLKLILTIGAIFLIARKVDFSSLLPTIRQCRTGYLLIGILAQVAVSVLIAWRWRLLLALPGLSLRKYLYFVYLGYFFNAFLPSSASSEAIRVLAFGKKYGAMQQSIGVNLLARGFGIVLQLILGVASVWLFWDEMRDLKLFQKMAFDFRTLSIMVLALVAVAVIALRFRHVLKGQRWVAEIRRVLSDRPLLIKTALVTALIQAVSIFGLWALFASLYGGVRIWEIVVFPALIQVALVLPISFGGVGVRDYLNILLYSEVAGIPRDITLAVCILGYLPVLLLALAGWMWMVFRRYRSHA
jgi:uncharacterized membrane protein YbhN (UPF0104 family)